LSFPQRIMSLRDTNETNYDTRHRNCGWNTTAKRSRGAACFPLGKDTRSRLEPHCRRVQQVGGSPWTGMRVRSRVVGRRAGVMDCRCGGNPGARDSAPGIGTKKSALCDHPSPEAAKASTHSLGVRAPASSSKPEARLDRLCAEVHASRQEVEVVWSNAR
jgi:hypothetical protein